jgi:hypothetical protein
MKLETEQQVQITRRKLASLEKHYEDFRDKPTENEYVKEISLRSTKQFINQLKEEIAWYECHARLRTEVVEAGQTAGVGESGRDALSTSGDNGIR